MNGKSHRSRTLGNVGTVVIKVGTRLLSDENFLLNRTALSSVAANVLAARNAGARTVLVTSGAVGAGMGLLGLKKRPTSIIEKQACAAVGQSQLMHEYQLAFSKSGATTAQVLLTRSDISSRTKQQNIRRVMKRLLDDGIIPIVNENDVVADDELKFGDNDTLSGLVADLIDADLLIILTDVEGLYSSLHGKERIPIVTAISPEIYAIAGGEGSAASTGGMLTKIKTAEKMSRAGRATVIASGRPVDIVSGILAGDDVGTIFLPSGKKIVARKRWISDHLLTRGRIIVDRGAAEALRQKGGSLLPSGIRNVEETFPRGCAVLVVDETGATVGQGLTSYGSREILLIRGEKSSKIKSILGHTHGDEVIHRNDLVVLRS